MGFVLGCTTLFVKAVGLCALLLDVLSPSRASSLPHLDPGQPPFSINPTSPVGASLLAMAVGLRASMLNVSLRACPNGH